MRAVIADEKRAPHAEPFLVRLQAQAALFCASRFGSLFS
jgi:hypothetical protein